MKKINDLNNTKFFNDIYENNDELNFSFDDTIIKSNKKNPKSGEILYKLISSFYYVYEDENIIEFADHLHKYDDIHSLGVVDFNNRVKGIIVRKDFFDKLSKSYARDIYKNKNVKDIMDKTEIFFENESILTAAEILKATLKKIDNEYYILADNENYYSGIISTKSILVYLSEITQNDLDLSQKLQQRIVNEEEYIENSNIEILSLSKMAKEVGGDFYTNRNYDKSKWIISVCDVSGKGISASILTSLLGGMFNTYDFNHGIKKFIHILNDYIFKTFNLEKYITGIIMVLDQVTKELIFCDMGHSFIYLYSGNKIFKIKTNSRNYPIGINKNIKPAFNKITLKQNDILIIFTDGLIEMTNKEGKIYSLKNLEDIINNDKNKSLNNLKKDIIDNINDFINNYLQHDDITITLVRFK